MSKQRQDLVNEIKSNATHLTGDDKELASIYKLFADTDNPCITGLNSIINHIDQMEDSPLKSLVRESLQAHLDYAVAMHTIKRTRREVLKRLELQNAIARDGAICMWVSGYDCDMTYSEYGQVAATIEEYEEMLDDINSYAEGPTTIVVISKQEYNERKVITRDLAAEAWENGRGTSIIL